MKSIALFSIKGGVGKSTAAVNLAHGAATTGGRRTLLWDLDSQGAATFLMKLEDAPRGKARAGLSGKAGLSDLIVPSRWPLLDLLPADRSLRRLEGDLARSDKAGVLRKLLQSLKDDYDRVIIDCPPGLSELADRLFRAVDLIVVPVIPTPLSSRASAQLEEELARMEKSPPPRLYFWNLADRRKRLHRDMMATDPDRIIVPASAIMESVAAELRPIAALAPRTAAARAYATLWSAVEVALIRG